MIPNFILRQKVRTALKPVMPVVLLCALIATLPSLIAQTAGILTGGNIAAFLLGNIQTDAQLTALMTDPSRLWALLAAYPEDPLRLLSLGLTALAFLVSPFLTLGLNHTLLRVLRQQPIAVSTVFARAKYFLKALGLNLLIILKTYLWMLPGSAVMFLGSLLAIWLGQVQLLMIFSTAGSILMAVLMVRALLHYQMANVILADDPHKGLFAALRESIGIMRNRKLLFINLQLTMYIALMALTMVESVLSALLGGVISATLSMVVQLIVSVYMSANTVGFYLTNRGEEVQSE